MSLETHISDIQEKLKRREYPNEQSISQGIVLRLLSVLGWPVYDTQLVIPEYKIEAQRVDYALCNHKNKPIIFIEVKQHGNTLGADKQLFQYAFHAGVPFAIVTDGKEWHFYLPAEEGSYDERRVYKLDLIERDVQESSYQLNRYIGYNNVTSGNALESAREDYRNVYKGRQAKANIPVAWYKLLDEKGEILLDVISGKVESLCGFKPTQHQVLGFLSSLEIRTVPFQKFHSNTTKRENGAAIAQPPKFTRRAKIKVTFPDGDAICSPKVADTMVEVIKKIGEEKVRSLDIERCGVPIVSNQKYRKNVYSSGWKKIMPGIYIFTHSNTDGKFSLLNEINDGLDLGLVIEKA